MLSLEGTLNGEYDSLLIGAWVSTEMRITFFLLAIARKSSGCYRIFNNEIIFYLKRKRRTKSPEEYLNYKAYCQCSRKVEIENAT